MILAAVLDTNQWVSACLRPHGNPARIMQPAIQERLRILTCPGIWEELLDVLGRPHVQKGIQQGNIAVTAWLEEARAIAPWTPAMLQVDAVPADPDDNVVLACAVEWSADYIITGDQHLLDLSSYQGIAVVRPATFLELWKKMR